MTTERGRTHALTRLVEMREAGGFTLPAELLDAHALPAQVRAVPQPPLDAYTVQDAADELLHTLGRGETAGLAALAQSVRHADESGSATALGRRITVDALEHAENAAINTAADLADRVICDHLRPAFDETLGQVRRNRGALHGKPHDARALVTASAKARAAWSEVDACAGRYRILREARHLANVAGLRQAESDVQGMFATFAAPLVLTPGYSPGTSAAPPRIEFPADDIELMLWLTGDAAGAKPWLPTVSEQDAAWAAVFGEGVLTRQRAHRDALAIGARI